MAAQVLVPFHVDNAAGDDLVSKLESLMQMYKHRYGQLPTVCTLDRWTAAQMNQGEPVDQITIEGLTVEYLVTGNHSIVSFGHEPVEQDIFVSVKVAPTEETICDFLTDRARIYFGNADLLDPNHVPSTVKIPGTQNLQKDKSKKSKKSKKTERPLSPMQRAVQDYGGQWALEEGVEVYTWQTVRLRFFMADKAFRRL